MFAKVSETNDAQNELSKIVYFRQVSQVNDDHISELSIFFFNLKNRNKTIHDQLSLISQN